MGQLEICWQQQTAHGRLSSWHLKAWMASQSLPLPLWLHSSCHICGQKGERGKRRRWCHRSSLIAELAGWFGRALLLSQFVSSCIPGKKNVCKEIAKSHADYKCFMGSVSHVCPRQREREMCLAIMKLISCCFAFFLQWLIPPTLSLWWTEGWGSSRLFCAAFPISAQSPLTSSPRGALLTELNIGIGYRVNSPGAWGGLCLAGSRDATFFHNDMPQSWSTEDSPLEEGRVILRGSLSSSPCWDCTKGVGEEVNSPLKLCWGQSWSGNQSFSLNIFEQCFFSFSSKFSVEILNVKIPKAWKPKAFWFFQWKIRVFREKPTFLWSFPLTKDSIGH